MAWEAKPSEAGWQVPMPPTTSSSGRALASTARKASRPGALSSMVSRTVRSSLSRTGLVASATGDPEDSLTEDAREARKRVMQLRISRQATISLSEVDEPSQNFTERSVLGHTVRLPTVAKGAFPEDSTFRQAWNGVVTALLIYMGTYFVWRLCFVDFRLREAGAVTAASAASLPSAVAWFEDIVNYAFWFDLVINFFFSYQDEVNQEVLDLRLTARHYLRGGFAINVLACVPPEMVEFLTKSMPATANQGLRLARLQRVPRITRLMRMTRLAKAPACWKSLIKRFEKHRGARVLTLLIVFIWLVHLLACGWYLCAALHEDERNTWVYRREIDWKGTLLFEGSSMEAWFTAMYFVVTVFTTVGFGDVQPTTMGEMLFASLLMVIGVVYHSMIISEVINVVSSHDRNTVFTQQKRDVIESFAGHTDMKEDQRKQICDWIGRTAHHMLGEDYDRGEAAQLVTSRLMPRDLLASVPQGLFQGQLVQNVLLTSASKFGKLPPRLVVHLALLLVKVDYASESIVYEQGDHGSHLYLVYAGVFSYCLKWQRFKDENFSPFQLFCRHSAFGDIECMLGGRRRCTARCESRTGKLLVLPLEDLKDLCTTFPIFGIILKRFANERNHQQMRRRATAIYLAHYMDFAALLIQRFFTKKGGRQGPCSSKCTLVDSSEHCNVADVTTRLTHVSLDDRLEALDRQMNRKIDNVSREVSGLTNKIDTLTNIMSKFSEQYSNHVVTPPVSRAACPAVPDVAFRLATVVGGSPAPPRSTSLGYGEHRPGRRSTPELPGMIMASSPSTGTILG